MARAEHHALIIDGRGSISRLIEQRLAELGFNSFSHASTARQALALSERKAPDLVVVGDELPRGSAVATARRICLRHDAPALLARAATNDVAPPLPAGTQADGPFRMGDLAHVLARAQQVTPGAA